MTRNAHEIGVEMALEIMDTFHVVPQFTLSIARGLMQAGAERRFSDRTVIKEILEGAEGVFFARKDEFK
jgi:hypothetical protein